MDHPSLPDPDEARGSLEQVEASRRAAAAATRRPIWIDIAMALTIGAGVTLGLTGYGVAAITVLLLGSALLVIALRRTTRARGYVLDARMLRARAWRFALVYALLFVLIQFEPPAPWQRWYDGAVGVAAASLAFAWLRWEEQARVRRLADGDYDRYNLL